MHDSRHNLRRWMRRVCWIGLICLLPMAATGAAFGADDYPREFRFGVLNLLAGVNAKDAQVVIEMNFVKRNKARFPDISVRLELLKDVKVAHEMFEDQRLHAIALTSSDYLTLKESTPLLPLFISSQKSRPVEAYVLLTQNSVSSLGQLKQQPRRRLVVENYGQTHIGQMWLDTVLHENGHADSQSFFTVIRHADKPARMVLPVFFGQAEACLVPESALETMAELNPQIGQQLRVLLRSPGFVRSMTCAKQDLSTDLVAALKSNAVSMPNSVDGRQLMLIFRSKRHFVFEPQYMQETRRVYRQYHSQTDRR